MTTHALLGASSASRWLNCPGSARACENIEDKPSTFAAEGTVAHEVAENILRGTPMSSVDKVMRDHCQGYADYVLGIAAALPDSELHIEARVDYSEWVPGGFGTADAIVIAEGTMYVIDLKYGQGIQVYAEDNPQLRLYALGAWHAYNFLYDINEIHVCIYQPRLDHISVDKLDPDELLMWAEENVKPKAKKAWDGAKEYIPGSTQCKFCKIKATCRALLDQVLSTASEGFDSLEEVAPKDLSRLTSVEIGELLPHLELIRAWAKAVEGYAFKALVGGDPINGWKLVKGPAGNRKWTDENGVKRLLGSKGVHEDEYLKKVLISPPQCEKLLKKEDFLGFKHLITRSEGGPKLAPENDRRPAYDADASAGFEDIG